MSAAQRFGLVGDPPFMAQAVRRGNVVSVAGQVAIGDGGAIVGEGDFRAQVERAFDNVERWLAEAGASIADVVQMVCHLADPADAGVFLEVRSSRFGGTPPATTTVIAQMLLPGLLVELTALAVVEP
jgi:enamine deaminase RidA (YjgF/YER057c/UK114 family)